MRYSLVAEFLRPFEGWWGGARGRLHEITGVEVT